MKNRFLIIMTLIGFSLLLFSCHSDMTVLRLVFPEMVNDGETIEVIQVSGNIGKVPSASVDPIYKDVTYLSLDRHLDREDLLINNRLAEYLLPGQISNTLQEIEIPFGTITGDYYLIYDVNSIFKGLEPNILNNTIAKPIHINGFSNSGKDLTAINFLVEQDLVADSPISIFWTAYNFGQTATSQTEAKFYLSDDNVLETNIDLCLGSTIVSSLSGGEKRDYGFTPFIQNNNFGQKHLFLVLDGNNINDEFNEDNNVIYRRIKAQERRPDLETTSLNAPIGVQTNTSIAVTTRIRNSGKSSSGNFQLKYFLTNGTSINNGDVLYESTYNLGGLNSNGTVLYNHSITLPNDIPEGTYYLFAQVDSEDLIYEYTNNNNWKGLRLCVHQDFNNLVEENEAIHAHADARQSVDAPVFSREGYLTDDFIRSFVSEQMMVYPNPTNDKTNLSLTIPKDAEVSIFLRNITGQLLFNFTGKMQKGTHLKPLDLSRFPSGTYLIQVELEGQRFSKTIILE